MEQKPVQFCVECGTPRTPGQRFCANCGATVGTDAINPTAAASNSGQYGSNFSQADPKAPSSRNPPPPDTNAANFYTANNQGFTPPPPPASTTPSYNSYAANKGPEAQFYSQNPTPAPSSFTQPTNPPSYAQSQPQTTLPPNVPQYARKPKSRCGCIAIALLVILLLAVGFGIFALVRFVSNSATQVTGTPTSSSTPTSSGTTTSSTAIISSEQLNLPVTYASLNVTILSLQMARQFADDTENTDQAVVVRVNLNEKSASVQSPSYAEANTLFLILPDSTVVQSTNQQQGISPNNGIERKNWLDYPLTTQVKLDQLTLRFGTQTQNQMSIPLKPGADISKYADKTVSPNTKFQYAGLSWTLLKATQSYSYDGNQATTDNRYVILTLAAGNNSANDFNDNVGSYMRLQASGTTQQPDSTSTIPISIPTQTNSQGIVAFLMPQNATSFTLIMLAQAGSPPIPQVTQALQIP